MSETAKKLREAMKAKAMRLAKGDPKEKVDSSTWTPPEFENAGVKTGARPISKRAFKKGGKVVGKCEGGKAMHRADRSPRKSGGRAPITADTLVNRNVKEANEDREGIKHVGGFKKGGKVHKLGGGTIGNNPLSQQAQSMGSAAGMKYKKGGKVSHRKHRDGGGMTMDEMIQNNPAPAAPNFRDKNGNIPLPPRRQPHNPPPQQQPKPDYKNADPRLIAAKKGGKIRHEDEAEDKALIKKMVKPEARTGRATGGNVFSGDSKTKIPGATGGRSAHARGGKTGKGKTQVNIVIATGGHKPEAGMMPNAPVPMPQGGPRMPNTPMPPMGGGMPPMGAGAPPMPPQGMPPMARKSGGRTGYPIETGAGGGEARLDKIKAYGLKPAR